MKLKIALAGNPNSGKTTLFNALTGSNQFVGNWPGVTVEKKEGRLKGHKNVIVSDLPGVYSLSPYSLEEVITRDFLLDEKPDVILNIVDATNLERNLYLTTQLLELDIPVVMVLNMMDVMRKNKETLNLEGLSKALGCPVVEISAIKGEGIDEAASEAIRLAKEKKTVHPAHCFSGEVEHALAHIEEALLHHLPDQTQRFYAIKLFERDLKIAQRLNMTETQLAHINDDIKICEAAFDDDAESIIANERYNYITSIIERCYDKRRKLNISLTERIDNIVTHRFFALPIFALIMFVVYFVSVTTVGAWITDYTNDVIFGKIIPNAVEGFLVSINTADWLNSLILDGIIGGVGAVLGFVPQMFVLFGFLAFLEACGYMARVGFILDKLFRKIGLSGKSFIPMLIGTGCGVPGIMASRTIESDRDRKMTIITTTFMPCSAKLPMIALIAGALFGGAWWVAPSAYFMGIGAIILSGMILKKTTMFSGNPAPFVMELPNYHMPTAINLWRSIWERGWSFIKKAGTIILISSIAIWLLTNIGMVDGKISLVENFSDGFLALLGGLIAPLFAPLGFGDWQSAVATITGLVAKENVVGTFGVLFGFADAGQAGVNLWGPLTAHFTTLSAYSFLIFNLLCAPCFAAIGAIRREMNNGKWTWFAILYQTGFAYGVALIIFQMGNLLLNGIFGIGTAAAIGLLIFVVVYLAKPYRIADAGQNQMNSKKKGRFA
jgi:ferrous iron transport protein B